MLCKYIIFKYYYNIYRIICQKMIGYRVHSIITPPRAVKLHNHSYFHSGRLIRRQVF